MTIKVKNIKKEKDTIRFEVEGITPQMANTFRRMVLAHLPVMAIEKVIIYENDSVMHDEVLAHRLGLIPLITDTKTYNFKDACGCKGKGCSNCEVHFNLEKKGPCMVYTKDLKPSDIKIKPVYDNMPIIKLGEKQNLKLEAIAQLGRGVDHMKWQAALASYEENNGKYEFFVESFGQLSPEEVIKEGFKALDETLDNLETIIKSKK